MKATFKPDHRGVGEMLRSDFMQKVMLLHAYQIKMRAIALAPVAKEGSPHPGRYKESFHTKVHSRGGATKDRAEAIVYNDAPEAIFVEKGHRGREPYHILTRAAFG